MSTEEIYYQAEIEDIFKKKTFTISNTAISHGKKHFPLSEIKGVIRRITKTTIVGNIGKLSVEYFLEIGSKSGKAIDVQLLDTGSNQAETEQQYKEIYAALEKAYLIPKVNHYIGKIQRGESFQADDFTFSAKGLHLQKKRILRKPLSFDIPWDDVTWNIDKLQFLNIGSKSNRKASSHVSMEIDHVALELLMFLETYTQQA